MAAAGSKKSTKYVTVGETTYAPGDEIPKDVVALIDNPAVWESDEDDDADGDKK